MVRAALFLFKLVVIINVVLIITKNYNEWTIIWLIIGILGVIFCIFKS